MMNYHHKTVGIWGYGRVGRAAASFFSKRGASLLIYDKESVKADESVEIAQSIDQLFQADYLLPSPGIDIRAYRTVYRGTWLAELDLFHQHFHQPIIAITGSVGKTTVTSLLTQALSAAGWRVQAAGNIGIPCLQLIEQQDHLDAVILEVSSFQLEYAQSFAPDLAVWTNFHPNHLDRHGSMEEYFSAKCNLIKHQTSSQNALLHVELAEALKRYTLPSKRSFFGAAHNKEMPVPNYYLERDWIMVQRAESSAPIIALELLDKSVFPINWLVVYAAVDLLQVPPPVVEKLCPIPHRLEHVATKNGITFYNDSKSTTSASTLAALSVIKSSRTILFLGGLSKGVDRAPLIQSLQSKPLVVICFGGEADLLHMLCQQYQLISYRFATLDESFLFYSTIAQAGDSVLFSPAGASFDLFSHYEERGERFRMLVHQYK